MKWRDMLPRLVPAIPLLAVALGWAILQVLLAL